jgi:cell division septal protein FtsQ
MVGMDRSLAARSPAGRLSRGPRFPPGAKGFRLGGAASRAWEALRGGLLAVAARRRLRIATVCAAVALPLLGGGWLWLRHSPYAAVEHVVVSGLHGPQASAIESALVGAARGMSTLDPKTAALRAAVAAYPVVGEIRVITSFPHGMRIVVAEQPPVASVVAGGVRTAVAADGLVLGSALLSSTLPEIANDTAPANGSRLLNPLIREALSVLGAAPPQLDRLAAKAYFGPRGLTVAMRDGLLVYFGDETRPHAKWLSLARVLSEKTSATAIYVDVRLPGRPAAGFPAGSAPSALQGQAGETRRGVTESTVATLAAGLAAANPEAKSKVGGGEREGSTGEGSTATRAAEPGTETTSAESTGGPSEGG